MLCEVENCFIALMTWFVNYLLNSKTSCSTRREKQNVTTEAARLFLCDLSRTALINVREAEARAQSVQDSGVSPAVPWFKEKIQGTRQGSPTPSTKQHLLTKLDVQSSEFQPLPSARAFSLSVLQFRWSLCDWN